MIGLVVFQKIELNKTVPNVSKENIFLKITHQLIKRRNQETSIKV